MRADLTLIDPVLKSNEKKKHIDLLKEAISLQ